jgi:hypothetical protein
LVKSYRFDKTEKYEVSFHVLTKMLDDAPALMAKFGNVEGFHSVFSRIVKHTINGCDGRLMDSLQNLLFVVKNFFMQFPNSCYMDIFRNIVSKYATEKVFDLTISSLADCSVVLEEMIVNLNDLNVIDIMDSYFLLVTELIEISADLGKIMIACSPVIRNLAQAIHAADERCIHSIIIFTRSLISKEPNIIEDTMALGIARSFLEGIAERKFSDDVVPAISITLVDIYSVRPGSVQEVFRQFIESLPDNRFSSIEKEKLLSGIIK